MTVTLRPYQEELKADVKAEWDKGKRVVVMRSDTGSGKTATLANLVEEHKGASCIIAHRSEIVSQLSLALAKLGLYHDVIAAKKTRKHIAALHAKVLGKSYLSPSSLCKVASVDTLIRRDVAQWAATVTLWVTDEGHHLVLDNKWHKAISAFTRPDCLGLLPTATPSRADGKGLGTKDLGGSGVAEAMVEGPPMRWLIEEGYLCDYRVVCAADHLSQMLGEVGKSGDWSTSQQRAAAERSSIVGDVVQTFRTHGAGKNAIVFASDVKTAGEMMQAYLAAGLRAMLVTGETDDFLRARAFDDLAAHKIDVCLTVDIVSEGTDIPALDIGIFARPTASLAVYMQQFGRVLRPVYADGYDLSTREGRLAAIANGPKPRAVIIDHVGNFLRHMGGPDRPRPWSLADRQKRGSGPTGVKFQVCLECAAPFEKYLTECPYCGAPVPVPDAAHRSSPELVDGDMVLLDPQAFEALRQQIAEAQESVEAYRERLAAKCLPARFIAHNLKARKELLDYRAALDEVMSAWGGYRKSEGLTDRQMQRLFYERFGTDVMTARTLDKAATAALLDQIAVDLSVKLR